jgi:hypothetical protein
MSYGCNYDTSGSLVRSAILIRALTLRLKDAKTQRYLTGASLNMVDGILLGPRTLILWAFAFSGTSCMIHSQMKCRQCGSTRIYRSQRQGLREGLLLRFVFMAPYRCRDCGTRYIAFKRQHKIAKEKRNQSLAEYIGLRGREYKLRQWTIAFVVTIILLVIAITFLLRMIQS